MAAGKEALGSYGGCIMTKENLKPTVTLLSEKQVKEYRKLVGYPKKGTVVVRGYHTWVADGKGGVTYE